MSVCTSRAPVVFSQKLSMYIDKELTVYMDGA